MTNHIRSGFISQQTLSSLRELDESSLAKVESIVRRHVKACRDNGLDVESLERLYIEAMEVVRAETKFGEETQDPEMEALSKAPKVAFTQYLSPAKGED